MSLYNDRKPDSIWVRGYSQNLSPLPVPDEIFSKIFLYFDEKTLSNVVTVSKCWMINVITETKIDLIRKANNFIILLKDNVDQKNYTKEFKKIDDFFETVRANDDSFKNLNHSIILKISLIANIIPIIVKVNESEFSSLKNAFSEQKNHFFNPFAEKNFVDEIYEDIIAQMSVMKELGISIEKKRIIEKICQRTLKMVQKSTDPQLSISLLRSVETLVDVKNLRKEPSEPHFAEQIANAIPNIKEKSLALQIISLTVSADLGEAMRIATSIPDERVRDDTWDIILKRINEPVLNPT